ncbi:hypothetical protein [Roseisolibacter sp. H3M3-2]|uniref:hypothetical protein n=1 Tax=Roseisolibacter sp. H3M3-2 TaxID=3031323 RepID=UPI0023D9D2EF|nr:hypothetical protein [Roseisolibacter sp. H3M3-2]MDF1503979.1 hypothetical protein [Roseisolibacter sp. H3M3-2]
MPSLYDLAARLQAFAAGELTREALDAWIAPVLGADPLDVEHQDDVPWEDAPDEERLFWRLLYLVESSEPTDEGEGALRAVAGRAVRCLASTASPAATLELLPLVTDQPRLCTIVERHARGLVSRTGFLSVLANAGYPPHAKLWLTHAGGEALGALCERLTAGDYAEVARMLERVPSDARRADARRAAG